MSDLTIRPNLQSPIHAQYKKPRTGSEGFCDVVKKAVKRVNEMQAEADKSSQQLVKGQAGIHETMIVLQKADISLRLLLQIRNKAMDAYREIIRMSF